MVTSRDVSRAGSVLSNSNARNVLKRRNKPYKTEQQKIFAKKAKLDIQTTYHTRAPRGYTFLPLGTPDLAEACKELSRKRNLPINVVNAAPASDQHLDPAKVSHHIARIGYHFRCEVVEDACEALGYHPFEDTFITDADLVQKQQNSVIARAFAKHGVTFDRVKGNEETPEQVRTAIKELFPKIPQNDLDEVVRVAWDKNIKRVGRATNIPLSRRVQLAVIARIRHTYTDYDTLLKALGDWKTVRKEVEPFCLRTLIEWRGETGEDDEALEEIVRETIVIDDDDDDDDDSSSDDGNASDISMEISHRPAAAEDLRAEEVSERDHRFFQRRVPEGIQAQQTNLAREKIQTYRIQQQNASAHVHNQHATYPHATDRPFERIYIAPRGGTEAPDRVIVRGQVMHRVRGNAPLPYANLPGPYLQHDRPMQSIERDDNTYPPPPPPPGSPPPPPPPQPAAYHSQPTTPQATRLIEGSHHHIGSSGYAQPAHDFPQRQYDRRQPFPQAQHSGDVIDLTSSPRRMYDERRVAQPGAVRPRSSGGGRYVQPPAYHHSYARAPQGGPRGPRPRSSGGGRYVQPPAHHHSYARAPESAPRTPRALLGEAAHPKGSYHDANGVEYDPNRPLLDCRERVNHNTAPSSQYATPEQSAWHQREHILSGDARHAAYPTMHHPYQAPGAYQAQVPAPVAPPSAVPQPVHGAPAPVQQALYYPR